jgi:hypothetical protein
MRKIGNQWYADNFEERSLAHKELVGWACEWCKRNHGQEITFAVIQHPLKGYKKRKKSKSRKIVLIAHHPNYDTENPDAELIILCRACHGKAQKIHNAEVWETKKKQATRENIQKQKGKGQLELSFNETEYPVIQVDFPIAQFLHTMSREVKA